MSGIIVSKFVNPYLNLSLGHYFSKQVGVALPQKLLYLCSSHHGVFIGNNQNCWKECDMPKMNQDSVPLVRRDTGGGACYVDQGNRLFSFIEATEKPDTQRYYPILVEALNNLNLNGQTAELQGRNDIAIDQKKISGSAFTFDGKVFRHHGTLLHSVDKTALSRYLTPSKVKLESKGIASVAKRICNLVDINPALTVEELDDALIKAFQRQNPSSQRIVEIDEGNMDQHIADKALFQQIFDRFTSKEFLYNKNPEFTHKFELRFSFGIVELLLSCNKNKITGCEIFSDSLDLRFIDRLRNSLVSKEYSFEGVAQIREELSSGLGPEFQEKIDEFCNALRREFFE